MKLLFAGPGTGKTTRIKEIVGSCECLSKVLVLSFTNATIHDLLASFSEAGLAINESNCLTLHKYALRLNHQKNLTESTKNNSSMISDLKSTMVEHHFLFQNLIYSNDRKGITNKPILPTAFYCMGA